MEFDLSTIDEMNNPQSQVPLSMSMHSLVAQNQPPADPHHQLVWNQPPDLASLPLQDVIDIHNAPHPSLQPPHHRQLQAVHHSAPTHPQPHQPLHQPLHHQSLHMSAPVAHPVLQHADPAPRPVVGQKRRFEQDVTRINPAVNSNNEEEDDEVDDEGMDMSTDDDTSAEGHTTPGRLPTISLTEPLEIDPQVVCQMGGLPYADLCKERAREAFKEAKKNEHYANGDHDRLRRRKKNDTTMTPRQKYVRRLRMNQDSAAAARHAQEVYVQVLEKLVKTSEVEKKSFIVEMQQIRSQNDMLHRKVNELQVKIEELEEDSNNGALGIDEEKRSDPSFAKILDMLKPQTYIGAQPDMGVQPARAV